MRSRWSEELVVRQEPSEIPSHEALVDQGNCHFIGWKPHTAIPSSGAVKPAKYVLEAGSIKGTALGGWSGAERRQHSTNNHDYSIGWLGLSISTWDCAGPEDRSGGLPLPIRVTPVGSHVNPYNLVESKDKRSPLYKGC